MKIATVLVIGLLALVLFAPAPAIPAQFVELPANQKTAIAGIFVAAFALLFDFLIGKFAWLEFFKQYQEAWALATSAAAVTWLQNALPTGSDSVAIPGVGFVIAILLYLLARVTLRRLNIQGFV